MCQGWASRTLQDLFYDPQTSGVCCLPCRSRTRKAVWDELQQSVPEAKIVGMLPKTGVF